MKWFKRRRKAVSSPDDVASLLLKRSFDIVRGVSASQDLAKFLGVQERSQLAKVREELLLFSWFALDYWTSDSVFVCTQEERRTIKEALSYHWREIAGGGHEWQAILYTLQERLIAYAQIVNEEKGDNAKFLGFGKKLAEFCGMPEKSLLFMIPAAELFMKTTEPVSVVTRILRGS